MNFRTILSSKYLVTAEPELQEKTIAWLKLFAESTFSTVILDDDAGHHARDSLSADIRQDLKPYRLQKPTVLYRGLHWLDLDDFFFDMQNEVDIPLKKLKVGSIFPNTIVQPLSSWSRSRSVAERFSNGKFGALLKATIQPEQTIFDSELLPRDLCKDIKNICDEDEILVNSEDYDAEIVEFFIFRRRVKSIEEAIALNDAHEKNRLKEATT